MKTIIYYLTTIVAVVLSIALINSAGEAADQSTKLIYFVCAVGGVILGWIPAICSIGLYFTVCLFTWTWDEPPLDEGWGEIVLLQAVFVIAAILTLVIL